MFDQFRQVVRRSAEYQSLPWRACGSAHGFPLLSPHQPLRLAVKDQISDCWQALASTKRCWFWPERLLAGAFKRGSLLNTLPDIADLIRLVFSLFTPQSALFTGRFVILITMLFPSMCSRYNPWRIRSSALSRCVLNRICDPLDLYFFTSI